MEVFPERDGNSSVHMTLSPPFGVRMEVFPERDGNSPVPKHIDIIMIIKSEWRSSLKGMETGSMAFSVTLLSSTSPNGGLP